MSDLVRWDPFREMTSLRDAMDQLLESAWISPSRWLRSDSSYDVPMDVIENDDNYVVKASVPGFQADDLNVTVQDNVLTISGEVKAEEEKKGERYHLHERRWGSFSRSISLPNAVKSEAVEASYENGVLTLTLPKAEEVKCRRITIKGSGRKLFGK